MIPSPAPAPLDEFERRSILEELARHPHGRGMAGDEARRSRRTSPVCGDDVEVALVVERHRITRLTWQGEGCQISTAAASALALSAEGLSVEQFRDLGGRYLSSLRAEGVPVVDRFELAAFSAIARSPLRVNCASLAWLAALDALAEADR